MDLELHFKSKLRESLRYSCELFQSCSSFVAARAAFGQSAVRGQIEVRGVTGYSTFIDESFQDHLVGGASAHVYVTKRLSAGPKVLYMYRNDSDKDIIATANAAWDFSGGSRAQPYVGGQIGVMRHDDPYFAVTGWTLGSESV